LCKVVSYFKIDTLACPKKLESRRFSIITHPDLKLKQIPNFFNFTYKKVIFTGLFILKKLAVKKFCFFKSLQPKKYREAL
jgi:hypothetical protein